MRKTLLHKYMQTYKVTNFQQSKQPNVDNSSQTDMDFKQIAKSVLRT